MKTSIIVKDFKYRNLNSTVNLFSQYNKCFKLKLINYVYKELVTSIFFLYFHRNDSCFRDIPHITTKYCWSDLLDLQTVSNKYKVASHDNRNFFYKIQKYNLFFSLVRQLIYSQVLNVISLKTDNSIYTVLRSPHTDKKSREQFKKTQYRKLIRCLVSSKLVSLIVKKEFISSKIRISSLIGKQ